jgi:hypothetical protein
MHAFPQLPQLVVLVEVSTHVPLQNVRPPEQPEHVPETQVRPLVHAAPHAPQF